MFSGRLLSNADSRRAISEPCMCGNKVHCPKCGFHAIDWLRLSKDAAHEATAAKGNSEASKEFTLDEIAQAVGLLKALKRAKAGILTNPTSNSFKSTKKKSENPDNVTAMGM